MLTRTLFLTLACQLGVGCTTTHQLVPPNAAAFVEPQLKVRPLSRVSPSLLAIKDPITLGVEARVNGDYDQAYIHFYTAWIATPNNEDVSISFADIALRVGNSIQAYQAVSELHIDPERAKPALVSVLVLAEIAVGNSFDTEERLNEALEGSPKDARLWNALGRHHDSTGHHGQAQSCYKKALETGGSRAGVMNNFGMSLLMQGQHVSALSKFTQAVEIDPADNLYDNNRRLTLALMGDYDGATKGMGDRRASDILNDAGFIAMSRKNLELASGLFKAAIDQSATFHPKANANLEALQGSQRNISGS